MDPSKFEESDDIKRARGVALTTTPCSRDLESRPRNLRGSGSTTPKTSKDKYVQENHRQVQVNR